MGLPLSRRTERIVVVSLLGLCLGWQAFAFVTGRWGMDADESYMALAGLHILKGEPRIFFFGQNYMGCVEGYGYAAMRTITRTSAPITARLQTALQTLAFLATAWWLLRRSVGRRAALGGLAFLALPPAFLARWYLRIRGYAPPMILGNLVLLLLFEMRARPKRWAGPRGFFLLGLALGFGWYANPIALFHIVIAGLFVLLTPTVRRPFLGCFSLRDKWPLVANRLAIAAFLVLEVRAAIPPRQWTLLQILYEHRAIVLPVLALLLAVGVPPVLSRERRGKMLPWLATVGFLIGHAPALFVTWSLPVLNLKQSAGSLELFWLNLRTGPPLVFARMAGIADGPVLVVIGVSAFYLLILYAALRRLPRQSVPFRWLLVIPVPAYLLLSAQNLTVWGMERYFLPFYVCAAGVVGVGVSEIGRVAGRWAWIALAVPVAVFVWGVVAARSVPVDLPGGIPKREATILQACREMGAHHVLISEGDDMALRLTLFANEDPVFTNATGYFNRIPDYEAWFRSQDRVAVLCRRDWEERDKVPGEPASTVEGLLLYWPVPRAQVDRFVPLYTPPGGMPGVHPVKTQR